MDDPGPPAIRTKEEPLPSRRPRGLTETIGWSTAPADARIAAILFAVAGLAYLPGIGWGLPLGIGPAWTDGWSPDGIAPMGFGEVYYALFSDAPRFNLQYPMFHYYVQVVACAPVLLALWLSGGIAEFSTVWPYGLSDPPRALRALTVAGRIPSLLMGAGAVAAAFQIGRETWNRRAGLLGAVGVMTVAPLVFYSRTSNVDVPALFWTLLGVLALAAAARRGLTTERALAFGLFAALAIGTKDTAYASFLVMAPALLFVRGPEDWRERSRILAIGAAGAIAAYCVTSGLAIHPGRWWAHVRFLIHGPYDGYWEGAPTPGVMTTTLGRSALRLAGTLGWPLALLGIAGSIGAVRGRRRALWLLLPAVGAVVGVVVPFRFVFARFFLVPAAVLALFAGWALDRSLGHPRAAVRWGAALALAAALGWGVVRDVEMTWAMYAETRDEAAEWLAGVARPGDCVAVTLWKSKSPRLPEGVTIVEIPWLEDPIETMADVRPRFLIEVAASPGEDEEELLVTPALRRWLASDAGGYALVFEREYPGRLAGRLVAWVSPPVRIWMREGPASGDRSKCVDPAEAERPF